MTHAPSPDSAKAGWRYEELDQVLLTLQDIEDSALDDSVLDGSDDDGPRRFS
jgi:hypothetical protein